jgi:acetate kinase
VLALVIDTRPRAVRYFLYAVDGEQRERLIAGRISKIGSLVPLHEYEYGEKRGRGEGATTAANHFEAFARIASVLSSKTTGPEDYSSKLDVVAHRVPHGGQRLKAPVLVDDDVMAEIDAFSAFAPQRNPAALAGIRAGMNSFPNVPQVAVFDTAFHQSMPPEAYLYPLPYELYERCGLRRFGFHSISHRHAIGTAAAELGVFPEALRVMSLHVGEETSVSAFAGGRCVDTTAGLTAQAGLLGAATAGAVDAAAVTYLIESEGLTTDALLSMLTHSSGLLGLSGVSSDWSEIEREAAKGDSRCKQALAVFVHHLVRAIGGLVAVMGGMDVLVFTGEVAATSASLRKAVGERLRYFGVEIDDGRNDGAKTAQTATVSADTSMVKVVVVPSDDEATIVHDAVAVVAGDGAR